MNTSAYINIINHFNLFEIERAMVMRYSELNEINIIESEFLSNYIADFKPSEELQTAIKLLGDFSIEDLSVAFEQLIPSEDRIINGAFFTPAYIVDYIIETVAPKEYESIADVSCGCGAFLLGAIRYLKKRYNKSIADIVLNNIYGADILDYNVRRAKILIYLYAITHKEHIETCDIKILCCDTLKYDWNKKFDCIVGNPPYVRFQDLDDFTREYLCKNYTTTSFGTFNLYFAFFEIGYNLLSEKGRLGYITPNNYFTSLAGESLRSYFQNLQCIYKIVDFNATKVFKVQTYTAITFLNRNKNASIAYGRIASNQHPTKFLNVLYFSSNHYTNLLKGKWRLLCGEEQYNIKQIESIGQPIGELFNICAGIATLKDEVYSFFPDSADEKYYYFTRNNHHWKVEKELARSTVKISDMKCQEDVTNNQRHFIFPYKIIQGKMVAIPEHEMRILYPGCYEYFLSVRNILASRGKGKHIYTPFYSYGRTQGLNRTGIKIYTPTFSKYPRFLIDADKNSLFTNGYGIFFRESSNNLFYSHPLATINNIDIIQKILNSEIMNYYITATSVAIEGGYPCYQKNFIEKFTIPYLDMTQIKRIRDLSDRDELNTYLAEIYQIKLPAPNLCS